MTKIEIENRILQGTKNLPLDALSMIADFIDFIEHKYNKSSKNKGTILDIENLMPSHKMGRINIHV